MRITTKAGLAAFCLFLAAGMLGRGTLAYFADNETAAGNAFVAGSLDLTLNGCGNETGTWIIDPAAPGQRPETFEIRLRNSGQNPGDHIEIAFSHQIDEAANPVETDSNPASSSGDLARYIEITRLAYAGKVMVGPHPAAGHAVTDANGNGWIDLEDLTLAPNTAEHGPLDDLKPPPRQGGKQARKMRIALAFRGDAGNDLQGDVLITQVTFTLNQHASQ